MSRATTQQEEIIVGTGRNLSVASRDVVHRTGALHHCAHLLCVNHDRIFLQRRSRMRARNPDRWTSTVSGHITAADARQNGAFVAIRDAALKTLAHETIEELGFSLPVADEAVYIGYVNATSSGGGEICKCDSLVFTLNVDLLIQNVSTPEVEEVRHFSIREVERAVRLHGTLQGKDGNPHLLADNFAPVFGLFLAHHLDSADAGGA